MTAELEVAIAAAGTLTAIGGALAVLRGQSKILSDLLKWKESAIVQLDRADRLDPEVRTLRRRTHRANNRIEKILGRLALIREQLGETVDVVRDPEYQDEPGKDGE